MTKENNQLYLSRRDLLKYSGITSLAVAAPRDLFRSVPQLSSVNKEITSQQEAQDNWRELPEFQAGMSIVLYGYEGMDEDQDWIESASEEYFTHLKNNNVNSLSIVFPFVQENWKSNSVARDPVITPSDETLVTVVHKAQEKGFTTMLRPIMDEQTLIPDNQWRGSIKPENIDAWFESYTDFIVNYANLAQQEQISILSLGAELTGMEQYTQHWINMIDRVRGVYDGNLTYATNHDTFKYDVFNAEVAKELDFVGIDAFYPHNLPSGASAEQLAESWESYMSEIDAIKQLTGKEVVFTEIGTRSQEASYQVPFLWNDPEASVSQEDQAAYFAGACEATVDEVSGWYVWAGGLQSLETDPITDPGFDPTNKKAEKVISSCYEPLD